VNSLPGEILPTQAEDMSKNVLLANISHEIRTPMNAIKGMSDLLLLTQLNEMQRNYVNNIMGAIGSLLTVVDDILDFSKISSGKMELASEPYDTAAMLSDVAGIADLKASEKGVAFITDVDPFIPSSLVGDRARVKQILLNLLNNALKFTERGHIKLSARFKSGEKNVELSFRVEDTGIGITREDLQNLFRSFEADIGRSRDLEKIGLGLAITNKLVELRGGKIEVESIYGAGSVFSFSIQQGIGSNNPMAAAESPDQKNVLLFAGEPRGGAYAQMLRRLFVPFELCGNEEELAAAMAKSDYSHVIYSHSEGHRLIERYAPWRYGSRVFAVKDMKRISQQHTDPFIDVIYEPVLVTSLARALNKSKTEAGRAARGGSGIGEVSVRDANVLIVDDNEINLRVAEELLRQYGLEPTLASSGAEALEKVTAARYDLIFMDHMMPDMDGIEVTKRIRALGGQYSALPVVALTANAVSGMRELFLQNSLNDFLSKPIEIDELNRILRAWLPEDKIVAAAPEEITAPVQGEIPETGFLHDLALELEEELEVGGALMAIGGSQKTYCSILQVFYQTLPDRVALLEQYKAASNWEPFRVEVHGLKSALANIGAKRLSLQARLLEMAAQEFDAEPIESHYPEFADRASRLGKTLEAAFKRDCGEPLTQKSKASSDDVERLSFKLKESLHLLDALELDTVTELLDDLLKFEFGSVVDELLQKTRQSLDFFDYDSASRSIEDSLSALGSR
jgi:CheY-like chemotaxis protein